MPWFKSSFGSKKTILDDAIFESAIQQVEQIAGEKFKRKPQLMPVENEAEIYRLIDMRGIGTGLSGLLMDEVFIPAEDLVIFKRGKSYPHNLVHGAAHALFQQTRTDGSPDIREKECILSETFAHVVTYESRRLQGDFDFEWPGGRRERQHHWRVNYPVGREKHLFLKTARGKDGSIGQVSDPALPQKELVFLFEHPEHSHETTLRYISLCGRAGLYDYVRRLRYDESLPEDMDEWLQKTSDRCREMDSRGALLPKLMISRDAGKRRTVEYLLSYNGKQYFAGYASRTDGVEEDVVEDGMSHFLEQGFQYSKLKPNDYLRLTGPFAQRLADGIEGTVNSEIRYANFVAMFVKAMVAAGNQ